MTLLPAPIAANEPWSVTSPKIAPPLAVTVDELDWLTAAPIALSVVPELLAVGDRLHRERRVAAFGRWRRVDLRFRVDRRGRRDGLQEAPATARRRPAITDAPALPVAA